MRFNVITNIVYEILKDNENVSIKNHKNEYRYQNPPVTETSLLFLNTNLPFMSL